MTDGEARSKSTTKSRALNVRTIQHPSNKGFFIFMACCAFGAITMVALLVGGEIKGARVAPDIEPNAKMLDSAGPGL